MHIINETAKPAASGTSPLAASATAAPVKRVPRRPRRRWLLGLIALLTLAALAIAIHYWNLPQTEYMTAAADRGDIDATVTTTGNLNAGITVQVGSQVSGNIKELYADFNTKVKKGQLVALIDPAPFEPAVDQAKATLNSAKAAVLTGQATVAKSNCDLAPALANVTSQQADIVKAQSAADLAKVEADRRQVLIQQKATSQEDYDTAKANYDQALANIDAVKASLQAARLARSWCRPRKAARRTRRMRWPACFASATTCKRTKTTTSPFATWRKFAARRRIRRA